MHDQPILPPNWVIRHDAPADGITNMARDLALLETVRPGVATWRWYGWDRPTLSFGRNERTAGWYTPASVSESGLTVVRRPTGGRALLHARELTYSVTLPLAPAVGWRAAYDAINRILLVVLQAAGVPATASTGVSVAPEGLVCFDVPAPGEITVGGRKLVGSAVWRQQGGYLQHGSILIGDAQHRLHAARVPAHGDAPSEPSGSALPPAATLSALFPALEDAAIVARVTAALPAVLAGHGRTITHHHETGSGPDADDGVDAATAHHARPMGDPAWIWRR